MRPVYVLAPALLLLMGWIVWESFPSINPCLPSDDLSKAVLTATVRYTGPSSTPEDWAKAEKRRMKLLVWAKTLEDCRVKAAFRKWASIPRPSDDTAERLRLEPLVQILPRPPE